MSIFGAGADSLRASNVFGVWCHRPSGETDDGTDHHARPAQKPLGERNKARVHTHRRKTVRPRFGTQLSTSAAVASAFSSVWSIIWAMLSGVCPVPRPEPTRLAPSLTMFCTASGRRTVHSPQAVQFSDGPSGQVVRGATALYQAEPVAGYHLSGPRRDERLRQPTVPFADRD